MNPQSKSYYRDATIGLIILVVILGIVLLIYQVIIPSLDSYGEEYYKKGQLELTWYANSNNIIPYLEFYNVTNETTLENVDYTIEFKSIAEVCGGGS